MLNIGDYNQELINEMLEKRLLNKDISPDGKLMKFNYSKKATWDKVWNEVTLNFRGHTFEIDSGNIVAMAFPKFFNLSELETTLRLGMNSKKVSNVYEKVDGILGIIYFYEGKWRLDTRGRFNTPEANKGFEILNEKYDLSLVNKHYTLLVEIISQEFKIVIDYGEDEKLMLLSGFDIINGKELDYHEIEKISKITKMPLVRSYDTIEHTIEELEKLSKTLSKDFEGFVVRFDNNSRLKIKSEEYMTVSFLLENPTPLTIWRVMVNGKAREDILMLIPEEFRDIIDYYVNILERSYQKVKEEIYEEYGELIERINKETGLTISDRSFNKEIGLRMKTLKYKETVFLIKEDKLKKIEDCIMERIRPKNNILSSIY